MINTVKVSCPFKYFILIIWALIIHQVSYSQCVVGTSIPAAPATCNPGGSTALTSTNSASPSLIDNATTYYTGSGTRYAAFNLSTGPTVVNVCSGSLLNLSVYSLNTANVIINVFPGGTLRTNTIERFTLNIYGSVIATGDIYLQNNPTVNIASSGIFQVYPYNFNATSTAGKFYNEGTTEVNNFYLNSVPNPYICMNNSGCIRVRGLLTNNDNSSNPIQAGTSGGYFSLDQTTGSTTNNPLTNDPDVRVCLKTAQTNFCKGPATAPCSGANNLFNGGNVNPASCSSGGSAKCVNPLPIVLNSYQLKKTQEGVQLSWSSFHTKATDHFLVEVSQNGIDWTALGNVDIRYASGQLSKFSYTDPLPKRGTNYYKITEINRDGSKENSLIDVIELTNLETLISIFPNPASDAFFIVSDSVPTARMDMYDLVGKVVVSKKLTEGKNEIDLSEFAKGMYLIKIKTGQEIYTRKLEVE